MSPCLCSDPECCFCGPFYGNDFCEQCGRWSGEGGCENPAACQAAEIEALAACEAETE